MKAYFISALAMASLLLVACQQDKIPPEAGKVLLTVNGEAITDKDVSITSEKIFSKAQNKILAKDIEQKAIDSMIAMMVIAQESEKKGSAEDLAAINSKVKRYREELLTDLYLRKHTAMTAPTESEIFDFYEKNKAFFGEKSIQQIAIVRTKHKTPDKDLPEVLSSLNSIRDIADWKAEQQHIQRSPGQLEYLVASTELPNLHPELMRAANSLKEGETSAIVYIDKRPHLVRQLKSLKKRAKPLAEVKKSIHKTLAAKKLKQQIKQVSEELVAKAEVKYSNGQSANKAK